VQLLIDLSCRTLVVHVDLDARRALLAGERETPILVVGSVLGLAAAEVLLEALFDPATLLRRVQAAIRRAWARL
jgi:hypothetical protein